MGDYDKKQVAAKMDRPAIYGNAVSFYKQLAYGKRIIVFCVNLTHVQHTLQAYQDAGIPAAALHGSMTQAERIKTNADFEACRILVLVTCELVSEGYDVPGCDGVQLMRPTQSLGLHLQQVGRCLRPGDNKRAIIIDHVGNCGRTVNGLWIPKHGFPTDERIWSLESGIVKQNTGPSAPSVRQCLQCYALMSAPATACEKCGAVFPVIDRTPDTVAGTLKRVTEPVDPISPEEAQALIGAAKTLHDWHNIARRLGKSHGWAFIQYRDAQYDAIRRIRQQQQQQTERV